MLLSQIELRKIYHVSHWVAHLVHMLLNPLCQGAYASPDLRGAALPIDPIKCPMPPACLGNCIGVFLCHAGFSSGYAAQPV